MTLRTKVVLWQIFELALAGGLLWFDQRVFLFYFFLRFLGLIDSVRAHTIRANVARLRIECRLRVLAETLGLTSSDFETRATMVASELERSVGPEAAEHLRQELELL